MIIKNHQSLLERIGLITIDQVRAYRGEVIKNHRGHRDILRIEGIDDAGRPLTLFLKRNLIPYRKDGLASILHHGEVRSVARQEWDHARCLAKAGIATATPVAYGEDCGPLWERFSFLITESAVGDTTLDVFLATCPDRSHRQRVLDALAALIRKMHDAGLASPDLFTRHIFLDTQSNPPRFCLIDMARLDCLEKVPNRRRARDLAALNITAPLRHVSARERLRFLRTYAGQADRKLFGLIRRRMRHLLRRRRFRNFLVPTGRNQR